MDSNDDTQIPIFRANKRRKVIIRPARIASNSPGSLPASPVPVTDVTATETTQDTLQNVERDDEEEHGGLASALRARHAFKRGLVARPVVSSAASAMERSQRSPRQEAQDQAENNNAVLEVASNDGVFDGRFAPPRGVVADVMDQAMTAYIDSRIRDIQVDQERLERATQQQQHQPQYLNQAAVKPREPVAAGRLQEIDLGPTATHQNLLRTQAAANRLDKIKSNNGVDPAAELMGRNGKKLKPRKGLGPDGKPWRPRRPRRTSDDLKRDALVESFMSAAPIEVFDNTAGAAASSTENGADATAADKDADERMLEQFQQDYYNAETNRRARKPPPVKGKEAETAKSSGPRLGGSRSARAAMYKKMQEEAQQKKPSA